MIFPSLWFCFPHVFYTEQITFTKHLETLPLTKLEFPLHIWNAFSLSFKYPHFGGLGEKLHINKLDDSKYKESSEESSLPRLRGRLLQSCRAHCLSSKAQTCCGQPVLPLVFLSLLLTVLFKISFWGDRTRGEKQEGRREKKKLDIFLPFLGLICSASRSKTTKRPKLIAACGLQDT